MIFDFKDYIDPSTHLYIEPTKKLPDIYPYAAIHDEENGVMGSCSTYFTRKNITNKTRTLSYNQVCEIYKNKFVFVASQNLRKKFLLLTKQQSIPNTFDFALHAYCMLERIGRCRQYGCIDISKESLKMPPKDLFYHRRLLITQKMITKQAISKQKLKGIMRIPLYYLNRFHVKHKSKISLLMGKILDSLKSAVSTNHILPVKYFNDNFGFISPSLSVKRLLQYFNLEHKLKELELPYSQAFPGLPVNQCYTVNKKERIALCYQLLDPNIDIEKELSKDLDKVEEEGSEEEDETVVCDDEDRDLEIIEMESQKSWLGLVNAITHVEPASDLSDSESLMSCQDQVDQEYNSSSGEEFVEETMDVSFLRKKGFIIDYENPVDLSFLKQIFKVVEEAGPKGVSALQVQKKLNLDRSEIRILIKHNAKYLSTYIKDEGRQRTQYYRLKKYENFNNEFNLSTHPPPSKKIKLESSEENETDKTLQINDNNCLNEYSMNETEALDSVKFVNTAITEHHHPKEKTLTSIFSTELQNHRAKDIIDFIDEMECIVGCNQMYYKLIEKDKVRQNPAKIDRKTVQKMMDKLVDHGYIKKFSVSFIIKDLEHTKKSTQIYAHYDLKVDSEVINAQVLKEKLKFSSIGHLRVSRISGQNIKIEPKFQKKAKDERKNLKQNEIDSVNDLKLEKNIHHDEGHGPKEEQVQIKVFESSNITVEITVLHPAKKVVYDINRLYPTSLMAERAVDCYNCIQEKHITVGYRDVMTFVMISDEKRNFKAKVDHRTIKKILVKLYTNNFIKCFKLLFRDNITNTEKEVLVYSVLDMSSEDTEFLQLVEREHLQFCYEANTANTPLPKEKPATLSEYVSLPKFAKMEKMHLLIFYVTYSSAKPLADQNLARENLEKNANIKLPEDHPPIYNDKELDDFTFLPSLAAPKSFPEGFISFQNFLPLIPIRTLLDCLRGTSGSYEQLETYYNDPVKRFYSVKDTRPDAFAMLTRNSQGRRNVGSLYNIFVHLGTIGLVQFGKKFTPEKENFAIYVNKHTSLRDTISAEPAYVKLNPENLKPLVSYRFQDVASVKKYWLDSCHICTNTPLGARTFAIGEKVRYYKKVTDKPIMAEACDHCDDINKILARDNGDIPGDNLGAAGYDSVTFAHMRRNWSLTSKVLKPLKVVKPNRNLTKPSKPFRESVHKKANSYVDRIVKMRKNTKIKKPKIIEKSSISLSSMRRIRTQVTWNSADSDVLHIIMIIYKLFKVKPCNRLTRDVLVQVLQKNIDGPLTAKLLASHYRRIMKNPENKERFLLLQAEVKYRKQVRNVLRPYMKTHWEICRDDRKMEAELFLIKNMVTIVGSVYDLTVMNQQKLEHNAFPSNYDEFLLEYEVVGSKETLHDIYPPLNSNNNIKVNVLLNLIHSSLATIVPEEDETFRHCLFDAYQRFPHNLIQKATRILKDYQVISPHKFNLQNPKKRTPLAIKRFKLNIKYFFKLSITEMQYSSFHGSYILFKQWSQSENSTVNIEHVDSACFNLLSAMLTEENVTIEIETPKTLLLLDPKIENLSGEYKHIVDRYYQLVDHYKVGTLHQHSDRNEDLDDEDDEKNIPPMNLFNAARLAMYTLKDVLIKEKISSQHIQRLLILNSCKIQLSGVNLLQKQYKLSQDYTKTMSEKLVVPALTQEQIDTLLSCGLEKQLSAFIESKLELGATNDHIRDKFGAVMQVRESLDSLIDKHVVIKTGNVIPVYVHNKHCSPWLVKMSPHPTSGSTVETQIAPWIHINSTINHPVLDYFLGVLLSYILFNPGVTLLGIQENYASVLQPMNITYLVDVLVHIKCITLQALTFVKPTLFTKSSSSLSPATGLEPPDCIHIEALPNAALRLGLFMGDISYEKNYLEHLSNTNLDNNEELDPLA